MINQRAPLSVALSLSRSLLFRHLLNGRGQGLRLSRVSLLLQLLITNENGTGSLGSVCINVSVYVEHCPTEATVEDAHVHMLIYSTCFTDNFTILSVDDTYFIIDIPLQTIHTASSYLHTDNVLYEKLDTLMWMHAQVGRDEALRCGWLLSTDTAHANAHTWQYINSGSLPESRLLEYRCKSFSCDWLQSCSFIKLL